MAQVAPMPSWSPHSNGESRQKLRKQAYNKRSGEDKSYDIKQSEGEGGVKRCHLEGPLGRSPRNRLERVKA